VQGRLRWAVGAHSRSRSNQALTPSTYRRQDVALKREHFADHLHETLTLTGASLPRTNVWLVLLRGGGQHPGHQQDESQSQRKEFRLNQREHDAMPTLDYHNCKRLITAAPTSATDNTRQRGPSQQIQASIWKYNARLYGRGLSKIAHSEGRASQS
jgi:hypothetical protein